MIVLDTSIISTFALIGAMDLRIEVFDLIEVLRALWRLGVCSKQQVWQLVADIESKEGAVIRRKGAIFAK